MSAGTSLSDKILGYQSTGYENIDTHGDKYNIPEGGIQLDRKDWIAVAEAIEERDNITGLVDQIKDPSVQFKGTIEQYLNCGEMYVRSHGRVPVTELKAMLDSGKYSKMGSISRAIEASLAAFSEEELERYLMMGFSNAQGWGGFEYVAEDIPEEPPEEPEDPPEIPEDPPEEPEDPPLPLYTITPGYAPEDTGYTAEGRIENGAFNTGPGLTGPIPCRENLTVSAISDLAGAVENLGYYMVEYHPHEYTATGDWTIYKEEFQGYEQKPIFSGDDPIPIGYEDDEDKPIYAYEVYDSGSSSQTETKSGVDYFIKLLPETKTYKTASVTINNPTLPSVTLNAGHTLNFIGSDVDNTPNGGQSKNVYSATEYYGRNETVPDWLAGSLQSECDAAVASQMAQDASDWWSINEDVLKVNNTPVRNNGTIRAGTDVIPGSQTITISDSILNNTPSGYDSDCIHNMEGAPMYAGSAYSSYPFGANKVYVHTPVHNTTTISSLVPNQLKVKEMAGGNTIVRLGEQFTITVTTKGTTHKYGNIETNKYIKSVEIICPFCGTISGKTHTCRLPQTKTDNTVYTVTTRVTACNSGPATKGYGKTNVPDDEYVVEQTVGLYAAGKIYDMRVRTTNDTGWKLPSAQGLSQLPIGEKGDNGNKIYKYAIKLGYKAYFDFKTLGVANKAVDITPKLYYVDVNGNVIENVDFYFKTSPTMYEKLGAKDLFLKMSLNSTNGEVNNSEFIKEKAITTQNKGGIDFSKILNIGKLGKITLTEENALHTTGPLNELRWYAEVYIPSSLVVAPAGTKLVDVSNGKGIYKTGYVVLTFTDVTTKLSDGRDYLQYSMVRDCLGNVIDFTKSIMYAEKAESGMFKNTINLSNGKTFSGYAETEIPVIVYDISMRANNDYETEGTH